MGTHPWPHVEVARRNLIRVDQGTEPVSLYRDDMDTELFEITTGARFATDVTQLAARFVSGFGDGILHVFVPHATAGIALLETGASSESDLEDTLAELLPLDDRYQHRHGSLGHGRDHVIPAFVSPAASIPVINGQLALGIWQSVVLIDTNKDNPNRKLRLSFLRG